jgi:site-specific DNA-cytosine methylase
MMMNYLDLFSGIGGFHLGLEKAGFKFKKVFNKVLEK